MKALLCVVVVLGLLLAVPAQIEAWDMPDDCGDFLNGGGQANGQDCIYALWVQYTRSHPWWDVDV